MKASVAVTLERNEMLVSLFILILFYVIILFLQLLFVPLHAQTHKTVRIMTAMELNAQIWRDMAEIADSESLMKQLAKYLKKLVAKKADPTLMTKEEFFAKLDKAERQMERGEYSVMLPGEDLTTHLKRLGYDI
jgi:hypothetical protein